MSIDTTSAVVSRDLVNHSSQQNVSQKLKRAEPAANVRDAVKTVQQNDTQQASLASNTRAAADVKSVNATAKSAQKERIDHSELEATVEQLNKSNLIERKLQFSIDPDSKKSIVTVRDAATNEVLRELPSKELREIAKRLEQALEKDDGKSQATGILVQARF